MYLGVRARPCHVVFLLLGSWLLAACRPGPPPDDSTTLAALHERLVVDVDRLVIPGRGWEEDLCDDEPWGFRRRASFWLWVAGGSESDQDLVLRLRAGAGRAGTTFRATWKGEEEISGSFEVNPSGWLEVTVPASLLEAGVHRLELAQSHQPRDEEIEPACFEQLRWRQGDRSAGISPGNRERLTYLEAFLSRGVVGLRHRKLGGTLFFGAGRLTESIALDKPGILRFELENASHGEARFRARAGKSIAEVVVPPATRRPLLLPLTRDRHQLELEVEGDSGGLFLWGAPRLELERSPPPTPVVLITLDTTRRDALAVYGHPEAVPTPHLAALAERATVYDHALASSPWTLPSHASIFTGLYPSRHGAGVWHDHLRSWHRTLAQRFRDAGYATGGFVGGPMAMSAYGLGRGFGVYVNPREIQERGDYLVDQAIAWIEEHRTMPFFLFLNLFDPHALYEAPEPWRTDFGVAELEARLEDSEFRAMAAGDANAWGRIIDGRAVPGEAELEWIRAAYRAEVAFTDAQLGRLFEALRSLSLFDSALIVVTSDHGELLGERGWFSHGCRLDPELIDIPLIVKWPRQSEGALSAEPVSLVDLYPTILSLLGPPPAGDLDGRPLPAPDSPDSGTSEPDPERRLLFEEHESVVHGLFTSMAPALHVWGQRQGERHEVLWPGGSECARREEGQWQFEACSGEPDRTLQEILQALGREPPDDSSRAFGDLDPEERAMLQALGYLPPEE